MEKHDDVIILHTMASQMNGMFDDFKNFKTDMKLICERMKTFDEFQNAVKQELFLIGNSQLSHLKASSSHQESSSSLPSLVPTTIERTSEKTESSVLPSKPKQKPVPVVKQPEHAISNVSNSKHTVNPVSVCFIGDSLVNSLDAAVIASAIETNVKIARAYTSLDDKSENEAQSASKLPDRSFQKVVHEEMTKEEHQLLILQAGAADISNLKTNNIDNEKYEHYFQQQTVVAARNLVEVAEKHSKVILV